MDLNVGMSNVAAKEPGPGAVPEREMSPLEKIEKAEGDADLFMKSAIDNLSDFCEITSRQVSMEVSTQCRQTRGRYVRRLEYAVKALSALQEAAW